MAVAWVQDHTAGSLKSAGTTLSYSTTATVTAGNTLVAQILFDNAATASKPVVSSIGKMAGETNNWVFLGAARSASTSAGAFSSGEIWAIKTTVNWSVAAYTITLDTSVTMKAAAFREFSGAEATLRSTVGTAYSTTTTVASATTTGTTPVVGDLGVGLIFQSNTETAQNLASTGFTGGFAIGSTGSGAATNNVGRAAYQIMSAATHATLQGTSATAGNGSIVAILQKTPDPAITQAAYRLYADGTETGSTALAAQDTAYTVDLTSGDVNLGIRVRLQETAGSPLLAATDDYQLQWEKNTSGTWTSVATSTVAGYNSANLTDAAATTNRLGSGTGSFVAGEISETGLVTDLGWSASNHTELLYSLTLKQADLANADTLRFRLVRNAATTGFTYTQTPTINITVGAAAYVPPHITTSNIAAVTRSYYY